MGKKISVSQIETILDNKGLLDRKEPLIDRYKTAVYNQDIIDVMELELPPIEDISDKLPLFQGKVYAIRMDINANVDNHKKHMVAGLILQKIINRFITAIDKKTLTDSGGFNSAKALEYYTRKLDLDGIYFMSRFFPENMLQGLRSNHFDIIQTPKNLSVAREIEPHKYLAEQMKNGTFRNSHVYLSHSKYGGKIMQPFGEKFATSLTFTPDYIVSGLGAGTTLEGIQVPIKGISHAKIVLAENAELPLFATLPYPLVTANIPQDIVTQHKSEFNTINGFPDIVGSHADSINPLLSLSIQQQIDIVMQYTTTDWQSISNYLKDQNMPVGNSTAANLACATTLANQGNTVLTIICEPRRPFYGKDRK